MILRWSNNTNLAFTFEANDLAAYRVQGASALRSFVIASHRRVHRGEIRQTVSWCDTAALHVQIDGVWYNPGVIKRSQLAGTETGFFEPVEIRTPREESASLDALQAQHELWLNLNAARHWDAVVDCWRWNGVLSAHVMRLGDELDNLNNHDNQ